MFKHPAALTYPAILLGLLFFNCEVLIQCYSYNYPVDVIDNDGPSKPQGWIDPFDMGGSDIYASDDYKSLLPKDSNRNAPQPGWKYSSDSLNAEKYVLLYQRFINVLLRAIDLKDTTEVIALKFVQLELMIGEQDLRILQGFGSRGEQSGSIETVSETLNRILSESKPKQTPSSFNKVFLWLQKTAVKVISSPEWTVVTSVLLMLFAMMWLLFITQSYRLALFSVFFMIFFAGFGFNWMRMYEETEVEKNFDRIVHGDAPYHCTEQSLVWYEHVYYKWFGDDCLKFYKRRDVRTIVKISPTDVLSVTVSTMIIEPGKNIGKAYGNFIYGVIKHLPWYLKPIAVPLAFFVPPVFIIVLLAMFFNYRLSLSLTGIHILPSWTTPTVHRREDKYVEDISNSTNERCQSKGVFETVLSDCKKPLFVLMNLSAVKNLCTTSCDADKVDDNKSDLAPNTADRRNEEAVNNLNKSDVEDSKNDNVNNASESCKRRTKSIYTYGEGSSSVAICSDIKNLSDPSTNNFGGAGDQNCVPPPDNEKDMCFNTNKIS